MAEVKKEDPIDIGQAELSEEEDEESDEDPEPESKTYKAMFHPDNTAHFLATASNWWKFCIPLGLYYILQFGLALASANGYSDAERKHPCGVGADMKSGEEASAVYDMALFMLGIFHIIEWVRTTLLLTVTCLDGMGLLMWAWHITTPINALFGVVCYLYAHYARLNAAGQSCVENQPSRAKFLFAQILFFYITYILAALFIFSFPKVA